MRSCPQSPERCPRCVGMTVRDGPESAPLHATDTRTCSKKASTYVTMRFRKEGIDSMARVKAERDILAALPGSWTRSRTDDLLAPKTACRPVHPSLPIVAISITLPSEYTATIEMTPLSGKYTWSKALSASIRTCSGWQRTCSSSGMRRLRLPADRASKRRLRGQLDRVFTSLNRAKQVLVPIARAEDRTRLARPVRRVGPFVKHKRPLGVVIPAS